MQLTVDIDGDILKSAVETVFMQTYNQGVYGRSGGVLGFGTDSVQRAVGAWIEQQDYTPLIAEIAPGVLRAVLRRELILAIKAEAHKQVELLRDAGELSRLLAPGEDT